MKTVAVIPIKMNNQRFPGKNIKQFDDGTPLMHLIQAALLKSCEVDEVYVYCSSEKVESYLLEGVHFLKRPLELDADTVNSNHILEHFIREISADIYITCHATGPFTRSESIDRCIRAVKSGEYDSAFIATKLQQMIWQDRKPWNFDPDHIPRTQDLPPLWVETSDAFVFTKQVFETYHRRLGIHPFICEGTGIEGIDIDHPEDFEMANAIYMYYKYNGKTI